MCMKKVFHFFLNPSVHPQGIKKFAIVFSSIKFILITKLLFATIFLVEYIYSIEGVSAILKTHQPITPSGSSDQYKLLILLWAVVIAPIMEELSFRGLLTNKNTVIFSSVSMIITFLFNYIYTYFFKAYIPLTTFSRITISLFIFGMSVTAFSSSRLDFSNFIESHIRAITYVSITFFSIIHIPNYDLTALSSKQLLFLPLALFPYFTLAMSLNYIRVQAGLLWSIGFHCIYNVLATLPIILKLL